MMASQDAPEPVYTVIVRVPFRRGDFVDPAPVSWDAAKDRSLWKALLKTLENSDRNWSDLAIKYEVPLSFLLQQAAYLYDRQVSQVRAQLRRVGASKSTTASPVPGTEGGGEAMIRMTSAGQQQALSRAPLGRDYTPQDIEGGIHKPLHGRAGAPPISHNTLATAAGQLQSRYVRRASPKPAKAELHRCSLSPLPKSRPATAISSRPQAASPPSISSDGDESSDSNLPMQSRLLRRPPRRVLSSDDEEVDDSPTFLPFNDQSRAAPRKQASTATLRDSPRQTSRRTAANEKMNRSQASDSSASSTAQHHPVSHRDHGRVANADVGMAPIPRRTTELAGRSPQSTGHGQGAGRESDGALSMGSSFSDLDDASVTQSALEDALLSNMQHGGGMASKMSTLGQAFKSRYL